MKKEKLLELIQALPDGIEVAVLDPKKNLEDADNGDNEAAAGIYTDFTIQIIDAVVKDEIQPVAFIEIDTLSEESADQENESVKCGICSEPLINCLCD